jgi:hypothetical protein
MMMATDAQVAVVLDLAVFAMSKKIADADAPSRAELLGRMQLDHLERLAKLIEDALARGEASTANSG